MTVETASTIPQLNPSYPAQTDLVAELYKHIQLIKSVLIATFPNLTAPLAAASSDLNAVPGLETSVTSLDTSVGSLNGSVASLTTSILQHGVGITDIYSRINIYGTGAGDFVARGTVVLFVIPYVGAPPPSGWAFCDGTNGTPDLRGKLLGAADPGSTLADINDVEYITTAVGGTGAIYPTEYLTAIMKL